MPKSTLLLYIEQLKEEGLVEEVEGGKRGAKIVKCTQKGLAFIAENLNLFCEPQEAVEAVEKIVESYRDEASWLKTRAAVDKASTRTLLLLKLCAEVPQRYIDLKRETKLSDAGLYKKLNEIMRKGWLVKLPDGRYVLSRVGALYLEELEAEALLREAVKKLGVAAVKAELQRLLDRAHHSREACG